MFFSPSPAVSSAILQDEYLTSAVRTKEGDNAGSNQKAPRYTNLHQVALNSTKFNLHQVAPKFAPSCTTLHQVEPTCTKLLHVPPLITKLHQRATICTKLHQSAPRCPKLHHVALICTKLHHVALMCTKLHQSAPNCTMLH